MGEGGDPALSDKLVFQEYRFGLGNNAGKTNPITIRLPDSTLRESDAPVVSVGSLGANDVVLRDGNVSRRHAVIVTVDDVDGRGLAAPSAARCQLPPGHTPRHSPRRPELAPP